MPSCPARGLSLTQKFMEIVGSEIFWKGIASGVSTAQTVSPIFRLSIPLRATIEPMEDWLTSCFFSPSNS